MKKIKFLIPACALMIAFASCQRVAPNYAGVLMENYGKEGKSDFKVVSGRVSTWEWGDGTVSGALIRPTGRFRRACYAESR